MSARLARALPQYSPVGHPTRGQDWPRGLLLAWDVRSHRLRCPRVPGGEGL